jgi:predicted double-glycine peptidase
LAERGTPPDILAGVLPQRYGPQGLHVTWRSFASLDELQNAGLTLVLIKFGLLVDHYQVVLGFSGTNVIVADPLLGKQIIARDEFIRQWRFMGIVLKRVLL